MPNISTILPEVYMLTMACVVLVVDLFLGPRQKGVNYLLTLVTLIGAIAVTMLTRDNSVVLAFGDSFIRDPMADILKLFIFAIMVAVMMYSRRYIKDRDMFHGEFFVLALFAVLGMQIMISAYSFLTLYLGLELLSLSLYALVAFQRDTSRASEAAMKYFILGAIASGMLLYGISILYGLTGSLSFIDVHNQLVRMQGQTDISMIFGLVFVLVGIAFKFGAVPFHMWVPDVYHGAPTAVTMIISSASKIAAFAMIMRLLVEALGSLHASWQDILVLLAVLSIGAGNLIAIAQSNIKRMLAYSTIAHVGFILLGVMTGTREGYVASMFYTLTYALMSLGAFGVIAMLSHRDFEAENLEDFKGLNERNPWLAFVTMLVMFAMAGVPPLVGFYAKLNILQAVVQHGYVWLAVYAVLLSVVGAFYYLRIVKMMYFDKPTVDYAPGSSLDFNIALSVNGLLMLALGIFPSALLSLCIFAIR
ncbi:MAG: NADH-quinone oxidoreductase subunit NuoN [Thiotrichales bacterium]